MDKQAWLVRSVLGLLVVFAMGASQPACVSKEDLTTFGLLSDNQHRSEKSDVVRDSLIKADVKRLILMGDQISGHSEHYEDIWATWIEAGFTFEAVALGNHYRDYQEEIQFFRLPGEYYAAVKGPARFLVLHSSSTENIAEQAAWLRTELLNAQEKFVFVMFHHSPYTISEMHHWEEHREFHEAIRPLLHQFKSKITALLVGHDHIASVIDIGLPMILSAATAYPRNEQPTDNIQEGQHVQTRWLYKGHPGWTRMDLNAKNGDAWFNFINAENNKTSCTLLVRQGEAKLMENCTK